MRDGDREERTGRDDPATTERVVAAIPGLAEVQVGPQPKVTWEAAKKSLVDVDAEELASSLRSFGESVVQNQRNKRLRTSLPCLVALFGQSFEDFKTAYTDSDVAQMTKLYPKSDVDKEPLLMVDAWAGLDEAVKKKDDDRSRTAQYAKPAFIQYVKYVILHRETYPKVAKNIAKIGLAIGITTEISRWKAIFVYGFACSALIAGVASYSIWLTVKPSPAPTPSPSPSPSLGSVPCEENARGCRQRGAVCSPELRAKNGYVPPLWCDCFDSNGEGRWLKDGKCEVGESNNVPPDCNEGSVCTTEFAFCGTILAGGMRGQQVCRNGRLKAEHIKPGESKDTPSGMHPCEPGGSCNDGGFCSYADPKSGEIEILFCHANTPGSGRFIRPPTRR